MTLSQDEWDERFPLITSPAGEPIWEHDETLSVPLERVWTIISTCEDDGLYVTPGYRYVNRLGYVVTKVPWPDPHLQGVWDEPTQAEVANNRASAQQLEREEEEMDIFDKLQEELDNARAEADKFYNKGNKQAGTRSRGSLQAIKALAQEARIAIQEKKNS
jgi:small-conductance mechanosensitive channel